MSLYEAANKFRSLPACASASMSSLSLALPFSSARYKYTIFVIVWPRHRQQHYTENLF